MAFCSNAVLGADYAILFYTVLGADYAILFYAVLGANCVMTSPLCRP